MSRPIACRGRLFTIAFAVEKSGRIPGLEFIESLPIAEQAKVLRLFQLVADLGRSKNPEKFGDLGKGCSSSSRTRSGCRSSIIPGSGV